MEGNVLFAFLLTTFAGLSTGIGSALAFFTKRENKKFLAGSLGFSAGVMIYVSFVEIFTKANDSLIIAFGEREAIIYTVISFFGGIFVILLIDKLIPSFENPHDIKHVEDIQGSTNKDRKLYRIGIFAAIAIAIHNFPEGMATFTAALIDPNLGVPIAIAIALHNIPEGIAVSIPIYYSTGDKKKSFWLSFASGLAEPVGAVIAWFLFKTILPASAFGFLFAGVAGIMVFISLDELLPAAKEYDTGHVAIYSLIIGMAVMAMSLILLG